MVAMTFDTMFQAFSDSNEKAWKYDRDASLGASEAFGCLRKAYFKKHGYEPDDGYEADWGAAKRGDIIENHFAVPAITAILPDGASLIYAGEEQETLRKGRLSATPDGLVIDVDKDALEQLGILDIESDCFVTEFKSFDPRANIKEAKAIHAGQVQVQLGLIHELTEFRPEYGLVIYFNASFLSDIRTYVVKRDPKIYAAAVARSKQVYATENPKDLMAEGKLSGDCNLCEFTEECAIAQGEATPREKRKIEDETILDRLALLIERQKTHAAIGKEAETERKLVDEEIKQILRDHDTKSAADDRFTVSLSWCAGKKSLDTLAVAAELEEHGKSLEDFQKEGSGYDRLTAKLKE